MHAHISTQPQDCAFVMFDLENAHVFLRFLWCIHDCMQFS